MIETFTALREIVSGAQTCMAPKLADEMGLIIKLARCHNVLPIDDRLALDAAQRVLKPSDTGELFGAQANRVSKQLIEPAMAITRPVHQRLYAGAQPIAN